ncbi:putative apoptosis-inducing factor -like protein B-like [Capsicum annuum]|nr:putative apoptosis-inducing factor -like protein B-like [Capsicum annuum]
MGNEKICMDMLSIEVSWSLFKRHAFENMNPMGHLELEVVENQIAATFKGLPLALKTLAGMLRSKSEVEVWKRILRSEIWELPDNDILPALMLSCNDLPAHLKQCFAYCAIYPKDYHFCKDQVIHLWLEENQGSHMLEQSQHMSYSIGEGGDFEKLKPLFKSEQLRTLLPINIQCLYQINLSKRVLHNILPRLTSLRALSLLHYEIVEVPNNLFIKLQLLRFWDISHTKIKKLPDSIYVLYSLETLLLSSCKDLEELPLWMEMLINLRHIDISNTSCLKMPLHLSKLKSLYVLVGSKFLLGGRGGSRMEDLGELHYLYGSLSLLELQNVVDRREALRANIREKATIGVE